MRNSLAVSTPVELTVGDMDEVILSGDRRTVTKLFNRHDPYGAERYVREKQLLMVLAAEQLSPRLIRSNDLQRRLTMAFYAHTPLKSGGISTSQYAWLAATAAALVRLHQVDLNLRPVRNVLTVSSLQDARALRKRIHAQQPAVTDFCTSRYSAAHYSAKEMAALLSDVARAIERIYASMKTCLIHGDLHSNNVLVRGADAVFIDLGKARIGDAAYDVALFCARTAGPRFLNLTSAQSQDLFLAFTAAYAAHANTPVEHVRRAVWGY